MWGFLVLLGNQTRDDMSGHWTRYELLGRQARDCWDIEHVGPILRWDVGHVLKRWDIEPAMNCLDNRPVMRLDVGHITKRREIGPSLTCQDVGPMLCWNVGHVKTHQEIKPAMSCQNVRHVIVGTSDPPSLTR